MTKPFKFTGAAVAAALLLTAAAAPAEARRGNWGGRGGGWHHRGGGTSFGDVVLGAAIIGGVAAVASSIANGNGDRGRDDGYDRGYEGGYEGRVGDDRGGYDDRAPRDAASAEEDSAVDRCADAALREAGADFEVRGIRTVERDGAGWRVEGDLTEQRGYGQSFVCGARADRVDFVQLHEPFAAR